MPIIVKFAKPSIQGKDPLSNAIVKHFKFVSQQYFDGIYMLIKEISQHTSSDCENIESITGIRFKIGEILFYPKNGNVHIITPDGQLDGIRQIAETYFHYVDCYKEWEDDEESILVINLA
ncbi:MAG: hypothetical protein IPP64_06680 [Bacteroidetes bacterium]|nr:hypothetical protein [Bacteroidota bacterium]